MDYDSFDDDEPCKKRSDDFVTILSDVCKRVNFKTAIFLLIISVVIFSDFFVEHVLVQFQDAVSGDSTTTKGTIIQILFLTFGYIIIDLLIQGRVI